MNRRTQRLKEHTFVENYGEADAKQQNHERDKVKRQQEREEADKRLHGDRGPASKFEIIKGEYQAGGLWHVVREGTLLVLSRLAENLIPRT